MSTLELDKVSADNYKQAIIFLGEALSATGEDVKRAKYLRAVYYIRFLYENGSEESVAAFKQLKAVANQVIEHIPL